MRQTSFLNELLWLAEEREKICSAFSWDEFTLICATPVLFFPD